MGSGSGEPMTSERLAEIQARVAGDDEPTLLWDGMGGALEQAENDRAALLAEVERLRAALDAREAREATLMAKYGQAIEIVLEIASGETIYYASHEGTFCVLCNGYIPGNVNVPEYDITQFPHTARCEVTKARALLASADEQAGDLNERSGGDGQR